MLKGKNKRGERIRSMHVGQRELKRLSEKVAFQYREKKSERVSYPNI